MRGWRRVAGTGLAGIALACAGAPVLVVADPAEDFSAFGSFAWLPHRGDPAAAGAGPPLRAAVGRELAARGLVPRERDADLLVRAHLAADGPLDVYRVWRSYVDAGFEVSVPEPRVDRWKQGTLVVDLIDARDRELVWRGTATARVPVEADAGTRTRRIDAAVAEILAGYPPAPR